MTLTRGWRLLRAFGLDQRERNNVLAACRNSLRFEDVVPSLRQQWLDDDIQNRDANRKGKSGKGSGKHGGKNKGGQVANYVGGEMMVVEQDGGWSYDNSGWSDIAETARQADAGWQEDWSSGGGWHAGQDPLTEALVWMDHYYHGGEGAATEGPDTPELQALTKPESDAQLMVLESVRTLRGCAGGRGKVQEGTRLRQGQG